MDIRTYLDKVGITQKEFGIRLGVSQGLVWQWLAGATKVTPQRAAQIERVTDGVVKRHELRPDVFDPPAPPAPDSPAARTSEVAA